MNYKGLVLKSRKKMLKLTVAQQKEIIKIYEDAITDLSSTAKSSQVGSLTERWYKDYAKQIKITKDILQKELEKSISKSIIQSGEYAIQPDKQLMIKASQKAGLDIEPHFTQMFSNVPHDVLLTLYKGDLYKDGEGLSERIWNYTNEFGQDIGYIIKRGIIEKKSAKDLAKDLEVFIKPESRRPWNWGEVYPNLRTKQVDYNAQRLARTSITHAYREAQVESAKENPFVEAIHWELSSAHYERQISCWGPDECDEYAEQNWYDLGVGNFPIDALPIGHPSCLCTTYPILSKSLDDITDELKAWIDGEYNPSLDEWYKKILKRK